MKLFALSLLTLSSLATAQALDGPYGAPMGYPALPYGAKHMICFANDAAGASYQAHGHSYNQFNLQQQSFNRCLKHSALPGTCAYGPCQFLY